MTMTIPNVLRITIENDSDTENPANFDYQWKIYTFNRSGYASDALITDCDPDQFQDDETGEFLPAIATKLANGLAFGMRHSEHGNSLYETTDDTSDGLIIWEHEESGIGARSSEDRRKDAESFLAEYTEWANGDCYWFKAEQIKSVAPDYDPADPSHNGAFWEEIDSCGGFIGPDAIKEAIREIIEDHADATLIYRGEACWIM